MGIRIESTEGDYFYGVTRWRNRHKNVIDHKHYLSRLIWSRNDGIVKQKS